MPSVFAGLERKVSAAVDGLYGEITRVHYRVTGGNFGSTADGGALPAQVVGIVDFKPVVVRMQDKSQYDGFQPDLAGDKSHVSYAESAFVAPNRFPRAGDEIELIDRAGFARLKVVRVDPDGIGRFICVCT